MENKICRYITYKEATTSSTAIKNGVDNIPSDKELACMKLVGEKIFDPVREFVGNPIKVESFFRCQRLNKMIGGAVRSQHRFGQAVDFDDDYGHAPNSEMFYWVAENLVYDQLIWEFGDGDNPGWIHASYVEGNNRNKLSIAYKDVNNKTKYKHFYNLLNFEKGLKEIYKR